MSTTSAPVTVHMLLTDWSRFNPSGEEDDVTAVCLDVLSPVSVRLTYDSRQIDMVFVNISNRAEPCQPFGCLTMPLRFPDRYMCLDSRAAQRKNYTEL